MKNLNKANIEKILENEIKYAKSWNYEIKIEIIIELNMLYLDSSFSLSLLFTLCISIEYL